MVIGVFVAAMSVIGCVGTHRQIQRDREWRSFNSSAATCVSFVSVEDLSCFYFVFSDCPTKTYLRKRASLP